jgi:hypothetical protein
MKDELGSFIDLLEEEIGSRPTARWVNVLKGDPCSYCGREPDPNLPSDHDHEMTVDHIIPLAMGGPYGYTINGTGACRFCNGRRKNLTLLIWLLREKRVNGSAQERKVPSRKINRFFTEEQIEQMKRIAGE